MDQQLSIQLFDLCRSGQLCETLAAILRPSLGSEVELPWDKHSPKIIDITEECEANEILNLMTLGVSDFSLPPINVPATMALVWLVLEKAKMAQRPKRSYSPRPSRTAALIH
jgi:hypothetical protein